MFPLRVKTSYTQSLGSFLLGCKTTQVHALSAYRPTSCATLGAQGTFRRGHQGLAWVLASLLQLCCDEWSLPLAILPWPHTLSTMPD